MRTTKWQLQPWQDAPLKVEHHCCFVSFPAVRRSSLWVFNQCLRFNNIKEEMLINSMIHFNSAWSRCMGMWWEDHAAVAFNFFFLRKQISQYIILGKHQYPLDCDESSCMPIQSANWTNCSVKVPVSGMTQILIAICCCSLLSLRHKVDKKRVRNYNVNYLLCNSIGKWIPLN